MNYTEGVLVIRITIKVRGWNNTKITLQSCNLYCCAPHM